MRGGRKRLCGDSEFAPLGQNDCTRGSGIARNFAEPSGTAGKLGTERVSVRRRALPGSRLGRARCCAVRGTFGGNRQRVAMPFKPV